MAAPNNANPPTPSHATQAPVVPDQPFVTDFERIGADTYQATLQVSEPNTSYERFKRILLGRPIPETLAGKERLNRVQALAILSSDALSSVAYGTEASLAVLLAAGAAALTTNLGIGLVTAALMLIVGNSYRQTIKAYPNGGGSYIVAKENLAVLPGLVAGAALLIDYLLTVSVSVASGIDAIASAFPVISRGKLPIELAVIVLIMLINLRGIRESGNIFSVPTYLFLGSFGLMLVVGLVQSLLHGGLTTAAVVTHATASTTEPLTVLLVLTAFASGCSAMTGVEAISNSVPIFNGTNPAEQSKRAAGTLVVMIGLLVTFFLGTTYLAWRSGSAPTPTGDPTVTAQIAHFAFQGAFGWLFYVVQTATLLILVFAANTSFAGFPRLAALLARDNFMPALFAYRGERIAYSVGIGTLGILSAIVLAIFNGRVTALINLYALGVFTAFTLSQSGMVIHWLRRQNEPGWQQRLIANGVGAVATGIVTIVIAIAKFDRGAWVVVILIPLIVLGFLGINNYYRRPRIIQTDQAPTTPADVVIVPIFSHQNLSQPLQPKHQHHQHHQHTWPQMLEQELTFALRCGADVVIARVVNDQAEADAYRASWDEYIAAKFPAQRPHIRVEALISPYRTVVLPLANFIQWQQQHDYKGKTIAVLVPRQKNPALWEMPLQRGIARRVRMQLEQQRTKVNIIDLPFTLAPRALPPSPPAQGTGPTP